MNNTRTKQTARRGQTLVIALIVLFVLLLIGFVFIGILNRNLIQTNTAQQRSVAADLADAGIRYAQEQLQDNALGADWRPAETQPIVIEDSAGNRYATMQAVITGGYRGPLYTSDPDEYYTRPAPLMQGSASQSFGQDLHAGDVQLDMGGPDGLGPFSRVPFRNGRALIRVRYAPSDVSVTTTSSFGPLRQPGKAHDYLIIESIGRPGALNANDPTSIPSFNFNSLPQFNVDEKYMNFLPGSTSPQGVMYQWFNTAADLQGAVPFWSQLDSQWVESRKLMAFASIGIIDDALFVTNINHTSNPAEIGIPYDLSVSANDDSGGTDAPVPVMPPMVLGKSTTAGEYNLPSGKTAVGGGSIQINGNALIYGSLQVALDQDLGESVSIAGTVTSQNALNVNATIPAPYPDAALTVTSYSSQAPANPTVNTFSDASGTPLSSGSTFNTESGVYRDGVEGVDNSGNPRGVPYRTPPDITHVDPSTGFNRYLTLTRDSGTFSANGNSGLYGHGRGVYVDNGGGDLQIQNDENGLIAAGASQTVVNDWLNPDNGAPGSAWVGPYYIPPGAFLQLLPDGFQITLDSKGSNTTWKTAAGADTTSPTLRFKINSTPGSTYGYIIDSTDANLTDPSPSFANGQPFNGVLYFEGNVRVRGVIPTYFPLTIVSMGNIYIEGSIVKGVTDANGNVISGQAPQTGIALMARDYVVMNTSMFFGPSPASTAVQEVASSSPGLLDPIDISAAAAQDTELWTEFILDPENTLGGHTVSVTTPQNWPAFPNEYVDAVSNQNITTRMMLTQAMQDGPSANAAVSMEVNNGEGSALTSSSYLFPTPGGGNSSEYVLGQESYQRYPQFETASLPLLTPNPAATYSTLVDPAGYGSYIVPAELASFFDLNANAQSATTPTNDYYLARSAVIPDDIRVEAMMYAEEGSFFVIPGPWFNPAPTDTRSSTTTGASTNSTTRQQNQLARLQAFGNDQYSPFYEEPLDVKITIMGSINENMPAPMSQQVEWDKKWAWIPGEHGSSAEYIPAVHNGANAGLDVTKGALYVPNLYMEYDPVFATGRVNGFQPAATNMAVRTNPQDPTGLSMLPPLPCLPVSPTLIYFGEVNP